jgi:hypothetical protein
MQPHNYGETIEDDDCILGHFNIQRLCCKAMKEHVDCIVDSFNMRRGNYELMKDAIDCMKEEVDSIFDSYNASQENIDRQSLFVSYRDGDTGCQDEDVGYQEADDG